MKKIVFLLSCALLTLSLPCQAVREAPPSESASRFPDEDSDNDGLTNSDEITANTDPENPDMDNDGFLDGVDGVPKDGDLHPARLPEPRFLRVKLGGFVPYFITDKGQALGVTSLWEKGEEKTITFSIPTEVEGNPVLGYDINGPAGMTDSGNFFFNVFVQYEVQDEPGNVYSYHGFFSGNTTTLNAVSASILAYGNYHELECVNGSGKYAGRNVYGPFLKATTTLNGASSNWEDTAAAFFSGTSAADEARLANPPDPNDRTFSFTENATSFTVFNAQGWDDHPNELKDINSNGVIVGLLEENHSTDRSVFSPPQYGNEHYRGLVWTDPQHAVDLGENFRPMAINDDLVAVGYDLLNYNSVVWIGTDSWKRKALPRLDSDFFVPLRLNNRFEMISGYQLVRNSKLYYLAEFFKGEADLSEFGALEMNNLGVIAASALSQSEGIKGFLLVPADIAVDANRDGTIRFAGNFESTQGRPTDKTTQDKPFRFWCNDDDDKGPQATEQVPVANPDNNDNQIGSVRDLEDFTRLWLHVGAFYDEISNGTFKVGLKWKNTNGTSPCVKVYKSADPNGSDDYLKEEQAGADQFAAEYRTAIATVTGSSAAVLPADFWTGYSEANPKRCLLFEGITEGKGQLCITIHKSDGTEIGEGPGVWLDIKNIKKMYQRVDSATAHPWENVAFEADPSEDKKEAVIFVHGWRMSPEGAGNFAETMYKRMWHRGFKGRFVAFHWDTWWHDGSSWVPWAGEAIDAYLARYNDSEKIAWQAGTALKTFVDNLSFDRKNIVAHSMGNVIAGQALVEGMAIQNYALLQAAVPSACYDDDEARIKQTSQYLYRAGILFFNMWDSPTPDADADPATKNLAYRGTFQNVAGNLINFYLPDDQATSFAWEINNDQTKPPLYQGENSNASLCFNYEYDPNGQPGEKLIRFELSALYPSYYVTSKPEAMSYACRTWGKAVGAWGATDGSLNGSPVNLKDPEFGSPRGFDTEHSAEFSRRIQQLKPFYDRLLDKLQVKRNP